MGMKRFVLALTLLFPGASAFAVNFTGHWRGSGQVTESGWTGNRSGPCGQIEIRIEHVASALTVQSYKATCGLMQPDWGPVPMEIRGTRVFEGETETGTLVDNLLRTLSADGGVQYAFNLRLNGEGGPAPTLDAYYGVRNLVGTIVIEGTLSPVP